MTKRRDIPEDRNLHNHNRGNPKSYKVPYESARPSDRIRVVDWYTPQHSSPVSQWRDFRLEWDVDLLW
jgi:hypothetical protein